MGVVQSVRFTAVCAHIAFDRHNASGFADAAGWGAALQTDRAHTTRHVSCGSSDVLLNCLLRPLPLRLQHMLLAYHCTQGRREGVATVTLTGQRRCNAHLI